MEYKRSSVTELEIQLLIKSKSAGTGNPQGWITRMKNEISNAKADRIPNAEKIPDRDWTLKAMAAAVKTKKARDMVKNGSTSHDRTMVQGSETSDLPVIYTQGKTRSKRPKGDLGKAIVGMSDPQRYTRSLKLAALHSEDNQSMNNGGSSRQETSEALERRLALEAADHHLEGHEKALALICSKLLQITSSVPCYLP